MWGGGVVVKREPHPTPLGLECGSYQDSFESYPYRVSLSRSQAIGLRDFLNAIPDLEPAPTERGATGE